MACRADTACGRPGFARAVFFAAALVTVAPVMAAEWDFTPRISGGVTWTDNVEAAGDAEEESEFITSLEPGFLLELQGPRAEMTLDYEAQALWYQDNSEFDEVYHNLFGTGLFTLVPRHFFVDAFARYDQENIDTAGRITSGNFFQTGNRTDAAVYGVSPWYQTSLAQWGEADVRYRYQGVTYTNTDTTDLDVEDSDTHSISGRLGSPSGKPGLNWNSRVSYTRTEFDSGSEFEYGQAALDAGVPAGLRSRITGTVGIESDVDSDPTKGGFDESFWYVGYTWEPTQLQRLEARVGERFYGTAYEFRWSRTGSRGDLSFEYTEEPTTANAGLFDGEGSFVGGRPGASSLDTGVYLSKRLNGRITYNLVRTRLEADLYSDRRELQGADRLETIDDDVWGVRLGADWDAAPRTRVNFFTRYEDRESTAGAESDYVEFNTGVRRDLTQTVFAQFRLYHVRRNFDAGDDYRINAATLSVGAEF